MSELTSSFGEPGRPSDLPLVAALRHRPHHADYLSPYTVMTSSLASCLFCKIIKGEIPSLKLLETDLSSVHHLGSLSSRLWPS